MKDFFFNLPQDCNIALVEGNYERVPRGIVTLNSFQVSTKDLTNKFIRGTYNKEVKDENGRKINEAHSARLFSIPLHITYSVEIRFDTMNEAFKLTDMILDTFYANRVYYFQYRGVRIPAQFRFPDSADINKNYKFDYNSAPDNYASIKMAVVMETYFPSFDKTSDRKRTKVMTQAQSGTINADTGQPLTNWGPFVDQNTKPPLYNPPQDSTNV
jgi:regulatory protein YycH of two-component signal transduction system YycFG